AHQQQPAEQQHRGERGDTGVHEPDQTRDDQDHAEDREPAEAPAELRRLVVRRGGLDPDCLLGPLLPPGPPSPEGRNPRVLRSAGPLTRGAVRDTGRGRLASRAWSPSYCTASPTRSPPSSSAIPPSATP